MTPEQIVRELRTADDGLRRFATHLAPGRADEALRRAYSSAITNRIPVLEGSRPSRRMFWEVRASSLALRTTSLAVASTEGDLAAAFHALPANERAALLLVGVEGVPVADAASVLGVTPERVVDLADGAADSLREGAPAVASLDDADLVAAIRDLPVIPAAPPFWDAIEREAANNAAGPRSGTSPWVWTAAAAAALVVIAGIALALSGGGDGDETVAIDTSTSVVVTTTTTTVPASTTAAPDTSVATTVTEPPSSTTLAATSTAAPTTSTVTTTTTTTVTGPVDRGEVTFDDGVATITGTLSGAGETWRLAIGDGQSLVAPTGVAGVEILVLDADGEPVAPEASVGPLQVFGSPGERTVQLRAGDAAPLDYDIGLGLGSADTGWFSVAPADDSAAAVSELTAMTVVECAATSDGMDAELEDTDDDLRLVIGSDPDVATWTGSTEASGAVTSITATPNGVLLDGTIDTGPDDLTGRSFGIVVLGCDQP